MLKKSKTLIEKEIFERVNDALYNNLSSLNDNRSLSIDELSYLISKSIALGVKIGLESIYSDEEFEQDIGLTS